MKKVLIPILCILTVLLISMTGCSRAEKRVNFGAGIYTNNPAVTNATEEVDGTGQIDVTVAAVTVDENGKILSCQLDSMSNSVKFTADGKAVANSEFKTKYDQGSSYNMVEYGGAKKEWFEQTDAFETVVTGKTLAEVKALVTEDNKGNNEVVNAGCTIAINEFVGAIEKAYKTATAEIIPPHSLKVNIVTDQTCTDATEEKEGSNKVAVNVFVGAFDEEERVLSASSDCVEVAFTFTVDGTATLDTSKAVSSKKDMGASYGMVAYGGAKKEWFEQASIFDNACIGKTINEIKTLKTENGKAKAELISAGCTIDVTSLVKTATK